GVPGKELERAIETGRASDERWHIRKDGTYFWAHGATTALRDETGVLKGFAKVLRDGTERKRFEELLNEQNQALEVSERRKDEFRAVLAHELRNLLAPICNVLAILEGESIPTNVQRKAYGVIGRQ